MLESDARIQALAHAERLVSAIVSSAIQVGTLKVVSSNGADHADHAARVVIRVASLFERYLLAQDDGRSQPDIDQGRE